MKLIKFDCGCIGFEPEPGDESHAWIIRRCDNDYYDSGYECVYREMTSSYRGRIQPKSFEYLTDEQTKKCLEELNLILYNGYKFIQVQQLLRIIEPNNP